MITLSGVLNYSIAALQTSSLNSSMSLDQMIFLKSLQKPEVADTLLVGP
jgi:hypothetical protein